MHMQAVIVPNLLQFNARERSTSPAAAQLDDIEQLVLTHRVRLLRFVTFSIGDTDLAESIVQDSFLKAYNARATFRGDCSIHTWLYSIALNLVRDHQRTQKFQFWRQAAKNAVDISVAAAFLPSGQTSPENRLLACERADEVKAAVETLSFNQKAAFLMRFQDDMELIEISVAMKMPVNTVKTHLHRAVKAVRERLGGATSR